MAEHIPSIESSQGDNPILADLTSRISQMWNQPPNPLSHKFVVASIDIKLNDTNYGLWSQVVKMYISNKDKLRYINGDLPQSQESDTSLRK